MRLIRCILLILILFGAVIPPGKSWSQVAGPEQLYHQFTEDTATIKGLIRASKQLNNNADSAIALLTQALRLSRQINYADGCASALLGIGTHTFNKGELEKSKAIFLQAYPYCKEAATPKKDLLLSWYNNMASPFAVQGRYDTATYYYYLALNRILQSSHPDSSMYVLILSNLATVWQKAGENPQAMVYAHRGLSLATQMHDSDRVADFEQTIGLIMNATGDQAAPAKWYKAALAMHLGRSNFRQASMDYCALAINTTNPDTALSYYSKALDISKLTNLEPSHKIYIGLGYAYLQKGSSADALKYLTLALDRATRLGFTDDLTFIYSGLADAYTANHNYQLANQYRKQYIQLRDSLTNKEKILTANTLEVKYRTAEKDKEIAESNLALLSKDNKLKKQSTWIILISSGIIILSILLIAFYRSTKRKEKLEKQRMLNIEQSQKINDLRSVIAGEEKERTRLAHELHDGIMVQLAAIKMKLRKERKSQPTNSGLGEILEQLDNTTTELRRTAHNLMPDMLLETGLTDALYYCCSNLQKGTDLDIVFQSYGTLPPLIQETELYLYRIVQELLQNIIKHAHASKALVQMNYHPPFLSFSVEDNGIGYDKDNINSGMGLKSIYSRLRALNGTIDIKSSKRTGTAIFFEVNIEPFIQSQTDNHADTGSHS